MPLDGRLDVFDVFLELELRRMHADGLKTERAVLFLPLKDVWQGANAVDARVGPEVDENDFSLQGREGYGVGNDPRLYSCEFRS